MTKTKEIIKTHMKYIEIHMKHLENLRQSIIEEVRETQDERLLMDLFAMCMGSLTRHDPPKIGRAHV